jgi:hypothetical protein
MARAPSGIATASRPIEQVRSPVPFRHRCQASTPGRRALLVGLRTLALYAFAAWVYIALVALVHPDTLVLQLTHLTKWPHEDTFGEVSFVVSLVCFFTHALLCDPGEKAGRRSHRQDASD